MTFKSPSRTATALTAGMLLLVATTLTARLLSAERTASETTTKLVCEMVESYHISQAGIDDDISSRLLNRYVKVLDPQKLYFTAADIEGMTKYRTQLDDLVKQGNTEFAFKTFDLYLARMKQRIERVHEWIDAEHDFTVDESLNTDTDTMNFAATEEEVDDRWRKRVKYDLLTLKIDGTELAEARDRLHKRYKNLLTTATQTEDNEILEMYLSSLTHCFDPHSSYMSPETLEDFQISMRLELEGIGAALRSEDGYTTVAQIVKGGAAAEDGRLEVGDKIIGVAQEGEQEFVDIVETKLSKVVRYIRGKKGTVVRLQVKKADDGKIEVYDLTRQRIELTQSEVKGKVIEAGTRVDGAPGRIGVVNIPSFYRDFGGAQAGQDDFKSTSRDVAKVLEEFRRRGDVDAVVVDLRMNGGGALTEAIEVSGLFIDKGPIVQVKEQDGKIKSHDDDVAGMLWDGPLVVVCNRLSASASEIFAGAIRDYGRGIVIGDETTHGKGTVQNVMPVGPRFFQLVNPQERGALKLTINQFYRVNGDSTQNKGVPSDVVLPSLIDHMDLGESFLDNALEFDHIDPARHDDYGLVSDELGRKLQAGSTERIAGVEKFVEARKRIEDYLERKERKTIPLNEEALKAERDAGDSNDEEEQPTVEEDEEIFKAEFYNDEIVRITLDYVNLLGDRKTARAGGR
jgi:carboxyl-terminal processing protease